MHKSIRSLSILLVFALILSLLPLASVFGAEKENADPAESLPLAEERTATRAVSVSSISVPAYSGGTASGWMTYDCGQYLGLANTGTQSKMQIIKSTSGAQLISYRDKLTSAGYTLLFQRAVTAQSGTNRHIKCLSPDGTFTVYAYYVEAYQETRIIVDTNADCFRRISYTGSGNNTGRTELYMVPFSASQDGYGYSSAYGSQNRNNAGAMYVIKLADNSLFVIDGGSYIQMSDRDCERVYAFLRKITGVPEGQKIVINTWFVTHYHDDHVSGFPRFLSKYYTHFDLQNVMYNFDVTGSSGDNMTIMGKLYPNAKYYKQHTGEYFDICDVRFEVLYTVEDLYTPNSSNQLITDDVGCMRKSDEENNCSSVLRVTFGGKTVLLTGDIYDADRILIAMYPQSYLHADVLQIPHHGFDGHVTLVKTVAPTISFLNQVESATNNRKDLYANNHNWMPYAGTIYYGNSNLVGYCAEEGIFLQEPFTDDVDWLGWGNLTRDMEEANYFESDTVTASEQYYRYDRVTSAPEKISGTYLLVDNKMGYPLSYNTSNGGVTNGSAAFYSNDRYYFGASQRRCVNWNMSFNSISDLSLVLADGGKGYYVSGSVKKGSGDYWGTNTKNANMALGRDDTFAASGIFSSWASFTNQMESSTNSLRLDLLQDNTVLLYARFNIDGSTYRPLYRDAYMATTDQGWGVSSLSKTAANEKLDYLKLRLYSYNTTPDTLLLSWTGHKDYYADPGISKSQALSLLTADLRVKYRFQNSNDSGEIYYDGWQKNAPGTYWLEFPEGFSGSIPGSYTITIKFSNHNGSAQTLGTFTLHIRDRSNDPAAKSLFFDFNDSTASRKAYEFDSQYNGINFDATSRWEFIEYNASTKTNDAAPGFVDTLSGTLKLYTKSADTVRKNLSVRTFAGSLNPLSYSPANAEVVQIRFKAENLKSSADGTANFRLCYLKDGGTDLVYETIYSLGADYVADGEYTVITVPLTQTFRNCASITGLRPAFSYVIPADTSKPGCITIDYLYIGPESGAPAEEDRNLFFDFTNTAADQQRYTAEAYNGLNFDRETNANWGTSETSTTAKIYNDYSISNTDGTLTVNVAEDLAYGTTNGYYGPWLVTSGCTEYFVDRDNREYHALGYEPKVGDYIQIRFKLEGCLSATGADPQIVVVYDRTTDGISDRGSYDMVASYTLENGVYQTVNIPVNAEFSGADVITNLGFRFWHIKAQAKGAGKVIIDYIYVGAKDSAPVASHTATFTAEDSTVLYRQEVPVGGTAVYAGEAPLKASDADYHYSFIGWDKSLTNITRNITFTPVFSATAHTYTYSSVDAATHKGTCSCGYTVTASHTYENGFCICKEPQVKEPIVNTAWKLGHTLNLASDISVNFAIAKSSLAGFDLSTIYIESILETYNGNEKTGTVSFCLTPVEKGDYYYFTLTGLTAVQMNDLILSTLYGTKDGQSYCSPLDDYSVADYAYSQMNKASMPEALKILCADLLRYGATAQIYKSYRTDHLADAAMTDTHRGLLSDIDAVTFGNNNIVLNDLSNPTITWPGKSLDLASKVTLKFIFNPASYTGNVDNLSLHLSYTGIDGETKTAILTNPELYNTQYGFYTFSFDGLLAAELRTVVSAQIYEGSTPVSCTLHYSADTYGNKKTGTLLDLCKALFAYSDSAKTYFQG